MVLQLKHLANMKVLYESIFRKLEFSKSENLIILTTKVNSVDYTIDEYVLDLHELIESGIAYFNTPIEKILIDSKEFYYLSSIPELEEVKRLTEKFLKLFKPHKLAFVMPSNNKFAVSVQIQIENLRQLDYNSQGFKNKENALAWLNK